MSSFPRPLRFWTAILILAYGCILHAAPVAAGLTASRPTGSTAIASVRDADLAAAQRVLEHRLVAQKLRDYGVSPEEVRQRLERMSDQDLHTLASVSRGLPSGGDGAGTIVTLLIIVLLVIVILKLLNKEIIVK